ncbi:MAG: hypothetical protein GF346_01640 [Candidatus Eisenbacteria bacterium]|nr:hypothetical protein [Candidatus Latescibacterota bacterium]MBD3301133.1 hypothetical protein [Candidatus Eisenbacteria bacterium]
MTKRPSEHWCSCLIPLCALIAFLAASAPLCAQGLFLPPEHCPVEYSPHDVVSCDVDGDYRLDLVAATGGAGSVSVLLNEGDGTFRPGAVYDVGTSPRAVVVARIDPDAHPDIFTSNSGSDDVSVLINKGEGTFSAAVHYAVGEEPWGDCRLRPGSRRRMSPGRTRWVPRRGCIWLRTSRTRSRV